MLTGWVTGWTFLPFALLGFLGPARIGFAWPSLRTAGVQRPRKRTSKWDKSNAFLGDPHKRFVARCPNVTFASEVFITCGAKRCEGSGKRTKTGGTQSHRFDPGTKCEKAGFNVIFCLNQSPLNYQALIIKLVVWIEFEFLEMENQPETPPHLHSESRS